jgi:hypothetical protein
METKKQILQKIKKQWEQIEYNLNNKSWSMYGEQYIKLNREESRQHLNFKPFSVIHYLTITEEAQFFAVQQIARYLYGNTAKPQTKDYLSSRKSIFYACALCENFEESLKAVMTQEQAEYFLKLDYCMFAQNADFTL